MQRVFVTGKVTDNKDPENLGRLKVKLHGFPEAIESPWLRAVMPHASKAGGGFVFLPAVGDEVVCLSPVYGEEVNQGHLSSMVILGCLYNGGAKPKFDGKDPDEPIKQIQTSSGHQILFDDKGMKVSLRAGSDTTSILFEGKSPSKITITAGAAKVTIGKDGAGSIDINAAGGKFTVAAAGGIELQSAAKISLSAPDIEIQGAKITAQAAAQVNLQAAMINFAGMTNLG
jgi:uncharacterized protein involved in type VI secretion and phage assembly